MEIRKWDFVVVNFILRKITIIQIALFFLIEEVSLTSYANKVKHMIGPNVQFYAILIEHLKVITTLKKMILQHHVPTTTHLLTSTTLIAWHT